MDPLDGGSGPTKSMWTMSKCASGVLNVPRGVMVCRCTFDRWHYWHDWAHFRTSDLILGQMYRLVTRRSVARTPGWDKEWRLSNTERRSDSGTTSRGTPVERLHMRVDGEAGIGMSLSRREEECCSAD